MSKTALGLEEICILIAEHALEYAGGIYNEAIGVEEAPTGNLKTVAALARVSKTFKEPALNALWRNSSDFGPFFFLLPPGLRSTVLLTPEDLFEVCADTSSTVSSHYR